MIPIGIERSKGGAAAVATALEKPDGFIKTSPISLIGGELTIASLDFEWRINQEVITNDEAYGTTIAPATDGFYRTDIIVTNGKSFLKIVGTEDGNEILIPNVPVGTLKVTEISLFGSNISIPSEPTDTTGLSDKLNRVGPDTFTGELTIDGDLILEDQKNVELSGGENIDSSKFFSFQPYVSGGQHQGGMDFAIDAAGNIYVPQYNLSKVVKISPAGVATDYGTTTGERPIAVRIDADGNVFTMNTANPPNRGFTKITPGGVITNIPISFGYSYDFILRSNGEIVIADRTMWKAVRYALDGTYIGFYNVGKWPMAICEDADGNIYTSNSGDNTVSKITPDGTVTVLATVGTNPIGICTDAAGNVYTANKDSNTVSKISPAGAVTTINVGTAPVDVIAAADGKVFVANQGSDNITMILPDNTPSIIATVGDSPSKLLFDATGKLLVLDSSQTVTTCDIYKITIETTVSSKKRFLTTDENGDVHLEELPVDTADLDLKVDKVAGERLINAAEQTQLTNLNTNLALKKDWTLGTNPIAGITYTIALNDYKTRGIFTNANPVAFTVPTNAAVACPIGAKYEYTVQGTGTVTISGAGTTLVGKNLVFTTGDTFVLTKTATDTWSVDGNLSISKPLGYSHNTYYVNTVTGNNSNGVFEDPTKPFASLDYVLGLSLPDNVNIVLSNPGIHIMSVPFQSGINGMIQSEEKVTLDMSSMNNVVCNNSNFRLLTIYIPNGILKNDKLGADSNGFFPSNTYNGLHLVCKELYWNTNSQFVHNVGYLYVKANKISSVGLGFLLNNQPGMGCFEDIEEFVCLSGTTTLRFVSMDVRIKKISGAGTPKFEGSSVSKFIIGDITTTGSAIVTANTNIEFNFSKITSANGIFFGDGYPGSTVISGKIISCPKISSQTHGQNGSVRLVNFIGDFGAGYFVQYNQNIVIENSSINCNAQLIKSQGSVGSGTITIKNSTITQTTPGTLATGFPSGESKNVVLANFSTNATAITNQVGTGHTIVQFNNY